eukprot:GHVT01080552.1.p1 GENE.GHVT01080552.1~~GHVT01080552.1.p1  ORF type:complete len:143 (+),score=4.30 GHVT01080552.1:202-630(+)
MPYSTEAQKKDERAPLLKTFEELFAAVFKRSPAVDMSSRWDRTSFQIEICTIRGELRILLYTEVRTPFHNVINWNSRRKEAAHTKKRCATARYLTRNDDRLQQRKPRTLTDTAENNTTMYCRTTVVAFFAGISLIGLFSMFD